MRPIPRPVRTRPRASVATFGDQPPRASPAGATILFSEPAPFSAQAILQPEATRVFLRQCLPVRNKMAEAHSIAFLPNASAAGPEKPVLRTAPDR